MITITQEVLDLMTKLGAFFDPTEVKWKPQSVKGSKALAISYVDARVIMERLDDCFGVGGWQTSYQVVKDGVVCKLKVRIGEQWCEHEDVGSFSEQPDEGDRLKAAFSDSLKRVAVHIGIGRYLYRMPQQWLDYDTQKRRFVNPPQLPHWAIPQGYKPPEPARTPAPAPHQAKPAPVPVQAPASAQGGAVRLVNAEQVKVLQQLIKATGTDPQAWCNHYSEILDVDRLPAERFEEARDLLQKKLTRLQKGEPVAAR